MQITGTFLKSKVSRRIAMLLLTAAIIPTMLMTLLSNQKVNQLIINYEHKSLVEKSRSYALTVFSNLIYARTSLEQASQLTASPTQQQTRLKTASKDISIFRSIVEATSDGLILNDSGNQYVSQKILQHLAKVKQGKAQLVVLQNKNASEPPKINLMLRRTDNTPMDTLLIAEINPNYLWGDEQDFPRDINICAYQINDNSNTKLFCSSYKNIPENNIKNAALNHGAWELFLRGEFYNNPWQFKVSRIDPITQNHLKEYVGSSAYIGITVLSLLIVGLLSLIQIRKTMVPLENLVKSTKKIANGDFTTVEVSGESEFSELANAFNDMSSYIQQQFDTLSSYAKIDKEITTKINIEKTVKLVIERMQSLEPNAIFCIAQIEEITANEAQCNCTISGHGLTASRFSISDNEIETIKRYGKGHTTQSDLNSSLVHERFMAELGAEYTWVLPIFWQGKIYAFMLMGTQTKLDAQYKYLAEFRELASRVGIVISSHRREQQLRIKAQYDSLTGLPNRTLLKDRLRTAMESSDRTGSPMWVVFIDLDRFKVINDSMGHSVGDLLLTEIGRRLQAEVRETDTVARFGGDEFVVALSEEIDENIKLAVVNRLMNAVTKPVIINNHELNNTCSMGISVYPNDGQSEETLIKNADIAMYRAKELGRNNYQFFTQGLNDKAADRMQMISLLYKAIENNEFSLHYQPKVDLGTQSIVGVEALI
ncbi:MAG: diguanylate cyclase domain-containing protein, partial [Methylophilaceae bacterium]